MTGAELKKAVKDGGFTIPFLSEHTGIPERTISYLYHQKLIEDYQLIKFKKAGVRVVLQNPEKFEDVGPSNELVKEMIAQYNTVILTLQATNKQLLEQNKILEVQNKKVDQRNDQLQDKCIKGIAKLEKSMQDIIKSLKSKGKG